jgi:hypothetical protein
MSEQDVEALLAMILVSLPNRSDAESTETIRAIRGAIRAYFAKVSE